jgi:hypothetical protein
MIEEILKKLVEELQRNTEATVENNKLLLLGNKVVEISQHDIISNGKKDEQPVVNSVDDNLAKENAELNKKACNCNVVPEADPDFDFPNDKTLQEIKDLSKTLFVKHDSARDKVLALYKTYVGDPAPNLLDKSIYNKFYAELELIDRDTDNLQEA